MPKSAGETASVSPQISNPLTLGEILGLDEVEPITDRNTLRKRAGTGAERLKIATSGTGIAGHVQQACAAPAHRNPRYSQHADEHGQSGPFCDHDIPSIRGRAGDEHRNRPHHSPVLKLEVHAHWSH